MPTYQYACKNGECGHRFELVQTFTEQAASECPQCSGSVRKVFSAVGVVFKGSGFYRTDSRAAAEKADGAADARAGNGSGSHPSDSSAGDTGSGSSGSPSSDSGSSDSTSSASAGPASKPAASKSSKGDATSTKSTKTANSSSGGNPRSADKSAAPA